MSIVLYKEGNTHTVNGVNCDIKLVDPDLFNGTPEPGWFMKPEEVYKKKKVITKKPKRETKKCQEPVIQKQS